MNKIIKGIPASEGFSIAKAFKIEEKKVKITNDKIIDSYKEIELFKEAINLTILKIEKIKEKALKTLGEKKASIFDAHIQVASDPSFFNEVKKMIEDSKINALYATNEVANKYISMFQSMDDEYMKERASDVKDVSKRIINILGNVEELDLASINEEVIIVAEDLTPSETSQLNKKYIKGFVTNVGGKTSHAAIMARTLEIPAILGLGDITKKINSGDIISIDGLTGEIILNPSQEQEDKIIKKQLNFKKEKQLELEFKGKKTLTKDLKHIELAANIGSTKDVKKAIQDDAESIGLFRSEFLYMDSQNWPTEDFQYESYSKVLKEMKGKRVIIRTLDIGGDKTLNYFDFPKEDNPFLGNRAIRMCLDKKNIFQTQLKALIRSSIHGKLAIMFPMIATIKELLEAKEQLEIAKRDLRSKKIEYSNEIEIGMMIEVPSAAVLSKQFAKHVDFFSIGTNDLLQYSMAADRMNKNVSYLYQPLNPSILSLINITIQGAHSKNKWVGMCGEMAADKNAIPILIGLGLDELSMSSNSILSTRKFISSINVEKAKKMAFQVLNLSTEEEVKEIVKNYNFKK